jgi:hypothetical protein
MKMKMTEAPTCRIDPAWQKYLEPAESAVRISTDCCRCNRDIGEAGGGVQVEPGRFVCWDCELPDEDLLEIAEQRLAAEAAAERAMEVR